MTKGKPGDDGGDSPRAALRTRRLPLTLRRLSRAERFGAFAAPADGVRAGIVRAA